MPRSRESSAAHFLGLFRASAAEPLRSDSSPWTQQGLSLLFRGYVAGASCLADRLGLAGNRPGEQTEPILAAAYRRWGAELPLHVDGEYALALYDWSTGTLTLMHDELGLTHLYYAETKDGFWFATSLPAMADRIGGLEIDEEYVADFLAVREHFGERTGFRQIRRLLPGQSYRVGDASRFAAFWSFKDLPAAALGCDAEYEERFRELVDEAVSGARPERGVTLCELSGGLDSSTIYCRASALGPTPAAMSWIFPESRHADERPAIEAVLQGRGGSWFPLDADSRPPFSALPQRWHAEPSPWLLVEGWDGMYRDLLAAEGVDVVLSGEGGDAVLMGDQHEPYFFADLLLRGRWRGLARQTRQWGRTTNTRRSSGYLLMANAVIPAWRYLRGRTLEHRRVAVPWLQPDYRRRYRLDRRGERSERWPADTVLAAQSLQRVRRSAHIAASYNRHRGDVAEFRHPLLYRPLLRFMLAVPPDRKMSPLRDRDLQRRALRERLPPFTLARSDKGGGDQPYYAGLEQGAEWVERLTGRPRVADRGYVDPGRWAEAVWQGALGRCVALKCLQATAAVEIWLQQLEERPPARTDPLAAVQTLA